MPFAAFGRQFSSSGVVSGVALRTIDPAQEPLLGSILRVTGILFCLILAGSDCSSPSNLAFFRETNAPQVQLSLLMLTMSLWILDPSLSHDGLCD